MLGGRTAGAELGPQDLSGCLALGMEEEMTAHSRILAWRIPWAEEPGRLQSVGLQEQDMTERLNDPSVALGKERTEGMLEPEAGGEGWGGEGGGGWGGMQSRAGPEKHQVAPGCQIGAQVRSWASHLQSSISSK